MSEPLILVVEDQRIIRERLCHIFRTPPAEWIIKYKFMNCVVMSATTIADVRRLLDWARQQKRCFDVIWYDLGLPVDDSSWHSKDDPTPGIAVLEELRRHANDLVECRYFGNIVVGTARHTEEILEKLLCTQIVQYYVEKPWDADDEIPYGTLVQAYRSWQQQRWPILQNQSVARWMEEERRLAVGHLTQTLVNSIGATLTQLRHLREALEDTFFLDCSSDCDHPVCRELIRTQESLVQIPADCETSVVTARHRGNSLQPENPPCANSIVEQVLNIVWCGIAFKTIQVELQIDDERPLNISERVACDVLQEVLFGAIRESAIGGSILITLDAPKDQSYLSIVVIDQARPMREKDWATATISTDRDRFDNRAWGLSLARIAAQNFGAKLRQIPSDEGNQFALDISLCQNPSDPIHVSPGSRADAPVAHG